MGALVQLSSASQLCPILCDPMDCSTPGIPVHHQLQLLCPTPAMVFPVVMYGCESWAINKAERRRIDAFELQKREDS